MQHTPYARRLIALALPIIALALTACGGSSNKPATVAAAKPAPAPATTTTVTQTVPPPTSNPSEGHDYPKSFETSFMRSCSKGHAAWESGCTCMLSMLESHLTYSKVVSEFADDTLTDDPVYQTGITRCAGQ